MKICEKPVRLTPNAKEKTASEASQRAIAADKKRKKRVKSGVTRRAGRTAGSVANEEKSL